MALLLAAVGGAVLGGGVMGYLSQRRERSWRRARLEEEARLRRVLLPVLERRADVLGIPPAARGSNDDEPLALSLLLATAIHAQEESSELPFGDTVEVSKRDLEAELSAHARR